MAKPLRAQRRLVPLGRRSLTLAQARRRQVRRWGVSRVSGERLMWGVRCQRAMRYLHLRPCGVRVPKRYDRPGRGCGGGATGLRPPLPLQSNLSRRMGQMVHGQSAVLVDSDSDAVRCSVGWRSVRRRGLWAKVRGRCPAVAGLYYAAEGAKEQSES